MKIRQSPLETANKLFNERYADSACFLLCGSTVRGDDTPNSDLDIVVIYKKLENAKRESFIYNGWPIEVFTHDLETLNYFFEKVDGPSRCPSLPQMVNEGILISKEDDFSIQTKNLAKNFLTKGPLEVSTDSLRHLRYSITDLIDDIRSPRNNNELISTGAKLLEVLSEFYFKINNTWSGKSKWIPRRIKDVDPNFEKHFFESFDMLFTSKDPSSVIHLCDELLKEQGGFLFEGHSLDAPKEWKLPLSNTE